MDPWKDILGLDLPEDRLLHDLTAFADIAEAIRKLRSLDLTDVHPAVVCDPTLSYRSGSE
jgi:hypothetical protein